MSLDYLSFAVILFLLGLVLFVAEYFLPTGGFLVVAGVTICAVAVCVVAYYGETSEAAAAVVALCVGVPLAGTTAMYYWGRRMALKVASTNDIDGPVELQGVADLDRLLGRTGKTASPMKPSGMVDIDGRRLDAVSEGMMLDAGVPIRCVAVRGGRVIVRPIAAPSDLADMDFDALQ